MIFEHTSKEPGMWRGWLKNGQSLELYWARRGWEFGAGVLVHSNDADRGDRMLCLKFWRFSAYIPLGVTAHDVDTNNEPQWWVFVNEECGLWFRWGRWSKMYDLPGSLFTVGYQQQMPDGSWVSVFQNEAKPSSEAHPYTYVLKSGEVQNRTATISKRRHVLNRRWLRRLGWPNHIKESIAIDFDNEVGERSGSWKGGCTGCSYTMRKGETMLDALRRMEAEREF